MAAVPSVTYSCHWGIFISLSFFSFFFFFPFFFAPFLRGYTTERNAPSPFPLFLYLSLLFLSLYYPRLSRYLSASPAAHRVRWLTRPRGGQKEQDEIG